jgi:hypothetical protein
MCFSELCGITTQATVFFIVTTCENLTSGVSSFLYSRGLCRLLKNIVICMLEFIYILLGYFISVGMFSPGRY